VVRTRGALLARSGQNFFFSNLIETENCPTETEDYSGLNLSHIHKMTTLSGISHIFGTVPRTFAHIRILFAHYSHTRRSIFSAIRTLFAMLFARPPSQRIPRDAHAIRNSSPHFPSYSCMYSLCRSYSQLCKHFTHHSKYLQGVHSYSHTIRTLFAHYSHTVAHYSHTIRTCQHPHQRC
jgi:hypothetical protein